MCLVAATVGCNEQKVERKKNTRKQPHYCMTCGFAERSGSPSTCKTTAYLLIKLLTTFRSPTIIKKKKMEHPQINNEKRKVTYWFFVLVLVLHLAQS